MRELISSIEEEYRRHKALGEGAIAQLDDGELGATGSSSCNSVVVLVWHLAGNLASRFTDFLTSDGEKPWRKRDEEFAPRTATRAELSRKWEHGWGILLETLSGLTDADLKRTVTIRGEELRVHAALHRSLSHASYHVGQIVHVVRSLRGDAWRSLSIPPGASEAYNRNPSLERPGDHAAALDPADRAGG